MQLLPVIPLQRGGEFPARLTSRASQQCCSEIRLIVNCSCSTAPLHAPAPLLVKNQSLVWLPCRGSPVFPVPALEAQKEHCFAHPAAVPTRGGCPPGRAAHMKISFLVFSAFKLSSLAGKMKHLWTLRKSYSRLPKARGRPPVDAAIYCSSEKLLCFWRKHLLKEFEIFTSSLLTCTNWHLAGAKSWAGLWPFPGTPPSCFPILMRNSPMASSCTQAWTSCSVGTRHWAPGSAQVEAGVWPSQVCQGSPAPAERPTPPLPKVSCDRWCQPFSEA